MSELLEGVRVSIWADNDLVSPHPPAPLTYSGVIIPESLRVTESQTRVSEVTPAPGLTPHSRPVAPDVMTPTQLGIAKKYL